jgi:TIR domain
MPLGGGAARPAFDVFISYARAPDLERVRELKRCLEDAGLSVWLDETAVESFEDITEGIVRGLSRVRAMLVYYSRAYLERTACQWELTAALTAVQQAADGPRRILVVNPEPGPDHIYPEDLRAALYRAVPQPAEPGALRLLAAQVAEHVHRCRGPLPIERPLVRPRWYPLARSESRFVGRVPDLFRLNRALHRGDHPATSGYFGLPAAQVTGLGGIGKTGLAIEYALRFGAAYPGGIFWLSAAGDDSHGRSRSDEELGGLLLAQLRRIAAAAGLGGVEPTVEAIGGALARAVERRGERCLWIVDDLPSDLSEEAARRWFAPHPLMYSLVTTRARRRYDKLAPEVHLDVLHPDEAYRLLTAYRRPSSPAERAEAAGVAADLGWHTLALHVAGAALRLHRGLLSFAGFRAELADPDQDALELAAQLSEDLPACSRGSIAATFLRGIRRLARQPGEDLIVLASCLAVGPISPALVARALRQVDGLSERTARHRAAQAFRQAEALSLAEADDESDAWRVHPLISRTTRLHDPNPPRRAQILAALLTLAA